jgi:hypothetical protein
VTKPSSEKVIKDIRRVTRKQYGAEEKIRIVLDGLRGEESIAALCRGLGRQRTDTKCPSKRNLCVPAPARSGVPGRHPQHETEPII